MTVMIAKIRSLVRTLMHSKQLDDDLEAELLAAVEELTRRYERSGMPRDQAERRARMEVAVPQTKEESRDVRVGIVLEAIWSDVRYSVRALRNSPAFAAAVVLTFMIGIGANTAIFTAVKELLLDPLPYDRPDRLVFIWSDLRAAGYPRAPLAAAELKDLRDRSTSFEQLGAIWANTIALTGENEPEQVRIGLVTTNFFSVLGVEPALGRSFRDDDEQRGAAPTILLSWDLWHRRFGSNPEIVGRAIEVNGIPTTVIGVMPQSFRLWMPPDSAVPADLQAWRPFARTIYEGPRGQQFLRVVGRLLPAKSVEEANADVAGVGRQIGREFADYTASAPLFSAVGLHDDVVREIRPALLALFAGVTLLMILACVNVANLLIARAAARRPEYALRVALGGSRARMFQQGVIEGLVLASCGAIAGIFFAVGLLRALVAMRPDALARLTGEIDGQVLAVVALTTVCWGTLVAAFPSLLIGHRRSLPTMIGQSRTAVGVSSRLDYPARALLVGFQVSVSLVLLVCAALLTSTIFELSATDLGFTARESLTFRVAPASRYPTPAAQNAFGAELQRQIESISGVESVGAVSHLPFDNLPNWSTPYRSALAGEDSPARDADARTLTPGYLKAIGATLIEGRDFVIDDEPGKQRVAIVDERLAKRTWPGESAVGKQVKTDPGTTGNPNTPVTVVGVVRHMRHRTVFSEVREQIYFPQRQVFRSPIAYVVNGKDRTAITQGVRESVARLDPSLPIFEMRPLGDYINRAMSVSRFTAALASVFSVIAVALAAIGLYGVLAYSVSRRQLEMAIRMAVGASRTRILTLIIREASTIVGIGLFLGLAAAVLAARALQPQLYGVSPYDVQTYSISVLLILLAAGLACVMPAIKMVRVQILQALRDS